MKSALKSYLESISQYKLLNTEEEKAYATRYLQDGDMNAREQLILSNLRLVVSIAKRYTNSHMELMDLIQEGNQGLLQAVDKYKPELGYRFSTCATPWIKQAITKSLIQKGKSIRIPAHIYQKLSKYRQAIADLTQKNGNVPTQEELAKYLNMDVSQVNELEDLRYDTVDLDTPIGGEDEEDTLADLQADHSTEGPEHYMERKDVERRLDDAIRKLKPRTQTIVKLRFGIRWPEDPEEFAHAHTLDEIGDYIGLTRERTRQILNETAVTLKPILEQLLA